MTKPWLARHWLRVVVHGVGIALLAWLGAVYAFGLAPLPDRYVMLLSGTLGLIFLTASLACTPLRWAGFARAGQVRRALGLYAFAFISIHLAVYAVAENGLDVALIVRDLDERRAMLIGAAAFVLLIPVLLWTTLSPSSTTPPCPSGSRIISTILMETASATSSNMPSTSRQ